MGQVYSPIGTVGYDRHRQGSIFGYQYICGTTLYAGNVTQQVVEAATAALDAVHAEGTLHADIRADNLLVVPNSGTASVLLIDLGFARHGTLKQSMREMKMLKSLLSFWSHHARVG